MSTITQIDCVTTAGRVYMTLLGCASCGTIFGITKDFEERRRADHKGFTCPNGHSNYFGESAEEKRVKKLERDLANSQEGERIAWANEQQAREEAKVANRRAGAAKGQLTKLRNRIANGVCPCCTRSFQNVRRHIESQHSEWAAEHAEAMAKS